MSLIYREMQFEDIEQVYLVDQACFDHNWSLDSYQKEMDNLLATYIVAKEQEKIVGYGGYWKIIDEAHITNLAVLAAYRKKGIGQTLFNKLCSKALAEGCQKMTLEVGEDNFPAISFYEKNDFKKAGVRRHYYGENHHALIMWRVCCES